ncbi:MAG: NAD-dependent epimerase/dehydratase family protein [Chloroflexota bacterium]
MRVLVTGAGGYTGNRLVRRFLADGHQVRALVHKPRHAASLREAGARVVIGDIANRAVLAGIAVNIDLVYHLVGTLAGGNEGIRRVLVEGTNNLIAQCRTVNGRAPIIVFTSNAVVYGDGRGTMLDEQSPCTPTFPLGQITLQAEEALRAAAVGPQAVSSIILRCGAIYGPGRLSSDLIRRGSFRIIGSGRNWSSRIHVDDLISTLIAVGESPCAGAVYCAVDHEPSPVNDYYAHLARLLGAPAPGHVSAWQARLRGNARTMAARLRGRAPFVDANVVGLFTADLRLNGARLRQELGLIPRFPDYRAGLEAALAEEAAARVGNLP